MQSFKLQPKKSFKKTSLKKLSSKEKVTSLPALKVRAEKATCLPHGSWICNLVKEKAVTLKKKSEQLPVTVAFWITMDGLETPAVITEAVKPENRNSKYMHLY